MTGEVRPSIVLGPGRGSKPSSEGRHRTPAMSSDLDAHYAVARRVAFQVEEQLQELETGRDTSAALQGNISTNLNQLAREITLLEGLLAEETSMARSGVWRR